MQKLTFGKMFMFGMVKQNKTRISVAGWNFKFGEQVTDGKAKNLFLLEIISKKGNTASFETFK